MKFKGPLTSERLGADLAAAGLSIKPAYCFMGEENVSEEVDFFRIGFGEAKFPSALAALSAFVDENEMDWEARTSRL